MYMRNGGCDIIFDASVCDDECRLGVGGEINDQFVKFLTTFVVGVSTFLFVKLKEIRSEKESTIRLPGENSGSRGEKDGKIPRTLE